MACREDRSPSDALRFLFRSCGLSWGSVCLELGLREGRVVTCRLRMGRMVFVSDFCLMSVLFATWCCCKDYWRQHSGCSRLRLRETHTRVTQHSDMYDWKDDLESVSSLDFATP